MKQQITKRAITESFRALLAVKPLDKITVRDIVEDCGLTRNTFYYHYEDIYDLLSDVLESEIERALSVPAGGASWETMLLDMLSFLTDSPQIGRHIFQSKCQDAMRVYLSKVISELSDRYIEQNVRDLDYSQQDRKLICDICCHAAKIEAMAADVAAHPDAGAVALRESKFAWAELLRRQDRRADAVKLYKELASDVRTKEGSAAAYYVLEDVFAGGDMDKAEKAIFAYSEREPQAYWLAKAFILLGDVYVRKGDNFQARATYQSVADGYSPADDGIVAEAKERIAKLN